MEYPLRRLSTLMCSRPAAKWTSAMQATILISGSGVTTLSGHSESNNHPMRFRLFWLFTAALTLAPLCLAQQVEVKRVATGGDEHSNQLKSFKAAFTEIYQGPEISRTESGTLWLKKPGPMRWEYPVPHVKLFLVNPDHAYFYVTGEQQARKTPVKNLDDIRSPLRYLLGKTKLEKELDGLSLAPDVSPIEPGNVVLRGVPKALKDRVS